LQGVPAGDLIEFFADLPGPLDVSASVERFSRWGEDLVDRWDGRTMVRTLHLPSGVVPFAAESVGTLEQPRLRVCIEAAVSGAHHAEPDEGRGSTPGGGQAGDRGAAAEVGAALRGMFVQADLAALVAQDEAVALANSRFPGLRPVIERDPLTALVRSISAQQINLTFAAVVRRRLVQAYGRRHSVGGFEVWSFDAQRLAGASVPAIRELQFTTRKAEYIVGVAQRITADPLHFEELQVLPNDEVIRRLTAMPGIGRWSAEWYLARTLGRAVVAAGDLGVRKAVGQAYFGSRMPSEDEVRQATGHWGQAAGVAQQLLLENFTNPRATERPMRAR
jgi:DNA-3-methyladenine glycosylase II